MKSYRNEMTRKLLLHEKLDLACLITTYAESDAVFKEFVELRLGLDAEKNGASVEQFKIAIDNVLGDDNLNRFLSLTFIIRHPPLGIIKTIYINLTH
jgi:hypothetical protein